jgi:ankyrin repeat protein
MEMLHLRYILIFTIHILGENCRETKCVITTFKNLEKILEDIERILTLDNAHLLKSYIDGDRNILTVVDDEGNNLLIRAFKLSLSDEVIALLMKYIDFKESNESGVTPFYEAIRKGRVDWVRYMVENGIDVDYTERESGFTPLMEATTSNKKEIVKILLESGATRGVRDSYGLSAYDFARKMKRTELMEMLKER